MTVLRRFRTWASVFSAVPAVPVRLDVQAPYRVREPLFCCAHDNDRVWVDVRVDAGDIACPCTDHPGVRCPYCCEVRDVQLNPDPRHVP